MGIYGERPSVDNYHNVYVCSLCGLRYPYTDNIHYFFNPCAEHWKITREAVKHHGHIGDDFKMGKFGRSPDGYPYTKLESASIVQRANALLFNISFELLYPVLTKAKCILEIGAFTGWASKLLSRYAKVIANDVSEFGLYAIDGNYGKGIIKVVSDGQFLPLCDESVDAIYMNATYHHMRDKVCALQEWHRILRPGGRLVASGESYRAPDWKITEKEDSQGEWNYTYDEMIATFQGSGFSHIERIPAEYVDYMEYRGLESVPDIDTQGINGIIFACK